MLHLFQTLVNLIWFTFITKYSWNYYIIYKYRGGVDRRNSFVGHYRSRFANKKWWFSVFERLFETALLNAYIIYKCLRPSHFPKSSTGIRVNFFYLICQDFRINLMYILSEKCKKHCPSFEIGSNSSFQKKIRYTQHFFLEGEE